MKYILLSMILIIGCVQNSTTVTDDHGCLDTEEWCDMKQKCLSTEPCVDDKTIQDFASCIAAGYPAMESYPRQCATSSGGHFVEPIPESSDCERMGGTWDMAAQECTGIDAPACQEIGGKFNPCASACRNDPQATVCTMQCVQVCEFDTTVVVTDFDSCVEAGNPVMESDPRQCKNGDSTFTEQKAESFCGTSTESPCDEDEDCRTGGCSGQICQSSKEEGLASDCEYKECYNNEAYDLKCGCFEGRCRWD